MIGDEAGLLAVLTGMAATLFSWLGFRALRVRQLRALGLDDPRLRSMWRLVVRPLARALAPRGTDLAQTIERLQPAGRTGRGEVDRFVEERALGFVLGIGFGVLVALAIPDSRGLVLALCLVAVGYVLPGRLVDSKAGERRAAISNALPAAVDLLTTCIDAGLSIEQSIDRVGLEFARSSPELAQELALTSSECEAGVGLSEALRRMGARVGHDDMIGLCAVISQASELGAPIVETLTEYADSARRLRMAKLEEWAGKLAMKMMFPVALFLLPSALVVMLGPSMMAVASAISGR